MLFPRRFGNFLGEESDESDVQDESMAVVEDAVSHAEPQRESNSLIKRETLLTAFSDDVEAVSYTHLDVYKRQGYIMVHGRKTSDGNLQGPCADKWAIFENIAQDALVKVPQEFLILTFRSVYQLIFWFLDLGLLRIINDRRSTQMGQIHGDFIAPLHRRILVCSGIFGDLRKEH